MGPHFGQIEGVIRRLVGVFLRHHLHAETPLREIAALDGIEKIFLGGLAGAADDFGSLGVGPVLVALHGLKMELHPESIILGVDETVSVAAVSVYVTHTDRQPAIRHQNCHLMQRLRRQRPEIPGGGGRAQVGLRMLLLGMDEVRKFVRVTDEKDRCVVAHHVPSESSHLFLVRMRRGIKCIAQGQGFIASAKGFNVIAILTQRPGSVIRSLSHKTVGHHFLILGNLSHALPEIVQWNVDGAFDASLFIFRWIKGN